MSPSGVRAIAFYLPQFHPIPENDRWWGKGFTEWSNVAKARPLFAGHEQPRLPGALGFYDLRLDEARQAQAELARDAGLHGFCYYHYWFNGRRVLEQPFEQVLASGEPALPFCLCWANENWTRRWDGQDADVLLEQAYGPTDDLAHIRSLADAFRDERYIRVGGRPLFLVYRATLLPDAAQTVSIWQTEARRLGIGDLYLCAVESFPSEHGRARALGFDAAVEFAPDWSALPRPSRRGPGWRALQRMGLSNAAYGRHRIFPYRGLVENMLAKPAPDYLRFPCVTPCWDNSARRRTNAAIFDGSSPELYASWLRETVQRVHERPSEERLVFINAWNEWGEGSHLEPSATWGDAYLKATRDALRAPDRQRQVKVPEHPTTYPLDEKSTPPVTVLDS